MLAIRCLKNWCEKFGVNRCVSVCMWKAMIPHKHKLTFSHSHIRKLHSRCYNIVVIGVWVCDDHIVSVNWDSNEHFSEWVLLDENWPWPVGTWNINNIDQITKIVCVDAILFFLSLCIVRKITGGITAAPLYSCSFYLSVSLCTDKHKNINNMQITLGFNVRSNEIISACEWHSLSWPMVVWMGI